MVDKVEDKKDNIKKKASDNKKVDEASIAERKKIIEEFANHKYDKADTSLPEKHDEDKTLPKKDDKFFILENDKVDPAASNYDEFTDFENDTVLDSSKWIMIIFIGLMVALVVFSFVLINNKSANMQLLSSQTQVDAPKNKKSMILVEKLNIDNMNSAKLTKEIDTLEQQLLNQQRQIAYLENNKSNLQRRIRDLSKQKEDYVTRTIETQETYSGPTYLGKQISSIWNVLRVDDEDIYLSQKGYTNPVKVNIGERLVDVGIITGIRRTNEKLYIIGSDKIIAEKE